MSEWAAKRFWKAVEIAKIDKGFGIMLDGRPVKTPLKATLCVPNAALADRVKTEWEAVDKTIDPRQMPFTRSVNAALDKVSAQHAEVADLIADYADADLLCYRAETPAELVARQAELWDPMIAWLNDIHSQKLVVNSGIMHKPQPLNTIAFLRQWTHDLGDFQLTAFHDLVSLSGSFVLGMATAQGEFDAAEIWEISRCDENWQVEQWGADDEAESVSLLKRRSFLHAAEFFTLA